VGAWSEPLRSSVIVLSVFTAGSHWMWHLRNRAWLPGSFHRPHQLQPATFPPAEGDPGPPGERDVPAGRPVEIHLAAVPAERANWMPFLLAAWHCFGRADPKNSRAESCLDAFCLKFLQGCAVSTVLPHLPSPGKKQHSVGGGKWKALLWSFEDTAQPVPDLHPPSLVHLGQVT
jgi:hypothetical protein